MTTLMTTERERDMLPSPYVRVTTRVVTEMLAPGRELREHSEVAHRGQEYFTVQQGDARVQIRIRDIADAIDNESYPNEVIDFFRAKLEHAGFAISPHIRPKRRRGRGK
jgi:hypothetical protein